MGLSWQKRRKSAAQSAGRITILHWTKPGAKPDVLRVDGHGQLSAKSGLLEPPAAVEGRHWSVSGCAAVPGSPSGASPGIEVDVERHGAE